MQWRRSVGPSLRLCGVGRVTSGRVWGSAVPLKLAMWQAARKACYSNLKVSRRRWIMRVRVGCEFTIESSSPTPTAGIVRPRDRDWHTLIAERRTVSPDIPVHSYIDGFGNQAWRWLAPTGVMQIRYDAIAEVPDSPDPVLADLPG